MIISCTENIDIDTQEGEQLVGINGTITNEFKKHQIVISKTAEFYSDDEIEMISGAEVFVYDGFDTICFVETKDKGHYETAEAVAGIIGRTYNLQVNIIDEDGEHNYHSQSKMRENIQQIDSMIIKPVNLGDINIPGTLGAYPYFLSVNDLQTTYLINAAVNDSLCNSSLIKCQSFFLGGLSGSYLNSPETAALIGEQPIYYFFGETSFDKENGLVVKESINHGDTISIFVYSITPEFSKYITDINSNFGSNPMMGMPYNVSTNIYPQGKAVGFFEATSVVKHSIIY